MYKYKKISELTVPESRVNMYGVVSQILKGVENPQKHAVLRVIDETCKENQYFRVHIYFRNDHVNPRFDVGDIVRFHRMKVEEYCNVIDGRIFRASDMVTFPPKGTGKEGAYSTAQRYHFADSDKLRLAELRKWIESRKKENKPADSVLKISNVSEEGTYALACKVLRVHKTTDDMLILIVTDCIPGKTGNDQTKKKEMKIVIVDPSDQLKNIPVNTDVILNNVKVDMRVVPSEEQERIIFCYWMIGPLCTFKLLRRFEDEAISLRKQIIDIEESEEENTADKFLKEIILFNTLSEEFRDLVKSQKIDCLKLVLLTQMKEAAEVLDNNVVRSQRSQDSDHLGNIDHSLLGVLDKMLQNSQLKLNMSSSTPIPNAPKENTECHVLPSTSKSKSIVLLSPQKINREVVVSGKLQKKISVPKSKKLSDLRAKKSEEKRSETNQKDARNVHCCMQDKSSNLSGSDTGDLPISTPRNAFLSEKCEIPAKENVPQYKKLNSKPNESHQMDDTSDEQNSNKTTPKRVPRNIFTLSPDMPNAACISNKQNFNKIMNNTLVRVVEKHCTSFEDEKLTNPFSHNLLQNKRRRNAHQGIGSNYGLPTKDDTMDREMRDRSKKNVAVERRTAQDTHLSHRESFRRQEKVVKNRSSSQRLITIEQSKKDSLLTILPIANEGEAERDGINNHSPELNNPSTFKEIAQVGIQKQPLEVTSHPALDDVIIYTYDSHPLQTHNIHLISEQQKLPHSMENVDMRNEELLPNSDFSENVSEADTGTILPSAVREFLENKDNEVELTTIASSEDRYSQFASVLKKNAEFFTSTQSSRNVSSDPVSRADESKGLSDCESEIVASSEIDVESLVRYGALNDVDSNRKLTVSSQVSDESEAYNIPFEKWSPESLSGEESQVTGIPLENNDNISCISCASTARRSLTFDEVDKSDKSSVLSRKELKKSEKTQALHVILPLEQMQRRLIPEENNFCLTESEHNSIDIQTGVTNSESFGITTKMQYIKDKQSEGFTSQMCENNSNAGRITLAHSLKITQNNSKTNNSSSLNGNVQNSEGVNPDSSAYTANERERQCDLDSLCEHFSINYRELQNIGRKIFHMKMGKKNIINVPREMESRERLSGNSLYKNDEEKMDVNNDEIENSHTSEDGSCFASGITDLPDLIVASISHIKQHEVNEETIFVLKAWLTKIEPSIDLKQKYPVTDIIFGSCHSCSKHYTFRSMNYEVKHICKNCHEQGKKVTNLTNLSFLLRLHLLDENDDSLVVNVCGLNAVDFLGCTVDLYLGDECTFNRVNKALSYLILQDNHLPPTNRGLMLKLIISPIMTSKGVEYIMHNTFLYIVKCLR